MKISKSISKAVKLSDVGKEITEREEGWYWIKIDDVWTIARLLYLNDNDKHCNWFVTGLEMAVDKLFDIEEIGDKIER